MSNNKENKVARIVTDRIIELMKQGVCPWNRPWKLNQSPINLKSKTPYKGFNKIMLLGTQMLENYSSNYWLTFKQAKALGGQVIKGSQSTPIIFWNKTCLIQHENEQKEWMKESQAKKLLRENPNKELIKESLLLKYYNVFNIDQIEGIEVPEEKQGEEIGSIERLDKIEKNWYSKPEIEEGGDKACFIPDFDIIKLPQKEQFKGTAEYYSVKWHEYGHATGSKNRLARKEITEKKGIEDYSKEELTAEIFSSSMLALAGIDQKIENNAAYIQNWIEQLQNDENMLIHAAARAQKAVDYVLSFSSDEKENQNKES